MNRERVVFDPDAIRIALTADLPSGLRAVADAIEAGELDGRLLSVQACGLGNQRDDRAHVRISLDVAARIFRTNEPKGLLGAQLHQRPRQEQTSRNTARENETRCDSASDQAAPPQSKAAQHGSAEQNTARPTSPIASANDASSPSELPSGSSPTPAYAPAETATADASPGVEDRAGGKGWAVLKLLANARFGLYLYEIGAPGMGVEFSEMDRLSRMGLVRCQLGKWFLSYEGREYLMLCPGGPE